MNAYGILGLKYGASRDEIESAFKRKIKERHPDLHPDDPQAAIKTRRLADARDMKKKDAGQTQILLYIAISTMAVLVFSFWFLSFGSPLQKILIVSGALVLFFVAAFGNQKVLEALQLVLVVGAGLAFIQLSPLISLSIMLFVAVLMVAYLYSIKHYRKEPIAAIGSLGFILFAIGLSFNTGSNPLITGLAISSGALAITAYSAIAFVLYRIRLQIAWATLNFLLAISPIMLVLSILGV